MKNNVPGYLEIEIEGQITHTSESYDRITNELKKLEGFTEEELEQTQHLVDKIHQHASRNMIQWESEEEPGVKEIISHIDILDLICEVTPDEDSARQIKEFKEKQNNIPTELTIISSSSPIGVVTKCLADGGSHIGFDRINQRTILEIARVVRSIKEGNVTNSKIILLGSPLASGGYVTQRFAEKIENEGIYYSQAKLHAEYLTPIIAKNNISKILFHGHSFAAIQSIITAGMINPNYYMAYTIDKDSNPVLYSKLSVLADDPVITHKKKEVAKGLQVMVGAAFDTFVSALSFADDMKAKPLSHISYLRQLDRLGIKYDDSQEQSNLKSRLQLTVLKQILFGPLSFNNTNLTDDHPFTVYMRKGLYDSTKTNLNRWLKYARILTEDKEIRAKKILDVMKEDGLKGKNFPLRKMHPTPLVTPKYFKRWIKTVHELQSLKPNIK